MHTATPEIYTLSLHDALPIWPKRIFFIGILGSTLLSLNFGMIQSYPAALANQIVSGAKISARNAPDTIRSEEHTSELQSQFHLVCRLLLEKKKKNKESYSKYL